jgi:hypothetical protein
MGSGPKSKYGQDDYSPYDRDPITEERNQILKKNSELDYEQFQSDLREILKTAQGKRLMWSFLERAGILQISFDNSGWTGFREGRRDQGLWMLYECEQVDADIMGKMKAESRKISDSRRQIAEK